MNLSGSHQHRDRHAAPPSWRESFHTPATEALHRSIRGVLIEDWETEEGFAPRPRFWRRPIVRQVRRAVLVVLVVFLVLLGWSIGGALTAPGTDSTAARLAEWGRDHGFNGVITWLEKQQYIHNQPTVGGAPPQGFRLYPHQNGPPNHYLSPSSRDWFGWYARP